MTADRLQPRWSPGVLLEPFSWAAEPVATMAQAEPRLLADLLAIGRARMHLIALALAHADPATTDLGLLLARGSCRQILDQTVGRQVIGIARALHHLPAEALAAENYRRLVALLDDRATAKVLHHLGAISDRTIRVLYELPRPLCSPVAVSLIGWPYKLDQFAEGLRVLVERGAASSLESLVADLAAATQAGQLIAKLKCLVEELCLPETLPPPTVGHGRRLDRVAEICALATAWENCLGTGVRQINEGRVAVYLWNDGAVCAACLAKRHGRLGWFLSQVKGPRNTDLGAPHLALIQTVFADAGIAQERVIAGIESIVEGADDDWIANAT